jgi:S-adenosylmethionine hydrolase
MKIGRRTVGKQASNYAGMKAGELFVIAGSAGFLEVSLNQASAASAVGAKPGARVDLRLL